MRPSGVARVAASSSTNALSAFIRTDYKPLSVVAMHNELNQSCQFNRRSHDAVIRVYDEEGNVIETHEHEGDFKEW